MLLQFLTKLNVTVIVTVIVTPIKVMKPFDTLHLAHLRPQM
jgi:hypothetical protein